MVAVKVVQNSHVEGGSGRALLLVSANMEVAVAGAAVGEPVDQPRVAVVGKDDGRVAAEHGIEFTVGKTMRMFARGLKGHQVHYIYDADFDVRKLPAQQVNRRSGLKRGDISRAGHHHIRLLA